MKCYIIGLLVFFALTVHANEIEFHNKFNLFSQKLNAGLNLPVSISEMTALSAVIEIPASSEPSIAKLFSKSYQFQEYKAVFEIYFFNQKGQKYFSQQVYLYKNDGLITRCTSYFGLEQRELVPGSCSGVVDGSLYGIAIYKL